MDHVVDTQPELYNASWLQSLEAFVLYAWYKQPGFQVSLCVCRDGSRVHGAGLRQCGWQEN